MGTIWDTWKIDTEAQIWLWVWVHQMFSPICFTNFVHDFFSVWAVEKVNKLSIGSKQIFFFSVHQLKKKSWQIFVKKIVDSEFEIGEIIWWILHMSLNSQKIWNALAQIFISLGKMVRYYFFYPLFAQEVLKSTTLPFAILIHYGRNFQILSKKYKAFFQSKQVKCDSKLPLNVSFWLTMVETCIWVTD